MDKVKKQALKRTITKAPLKTTEILEANKPLSKSMIWKLQSDFYSNQGPEAWSKGIVPQYITTNPYIANIYAKIAFGYCRDLASSDNFDKDTTIYLMELAAGVGRFTYTFLKRFLHLIDRSSLKGLKFKYIITDFAERNIEYWLNHCYLQPYFESGVLDCATFDMTKDEELHLRKSNITLKKGTINNPLIVFANYTFDSLPQDSFYVNNGQLYEGLITITSSDTASTSNDTSILSNLDYSYEDNKTDGSCYYEEIMINDILLFYQDCLEDTAFSLPIVSLRCIQRLIDLFCDDMVLISTDKGYRNVSSMDKNYHPFLSKHGSISLTVNFHAMELYFNGCGGNALHSIYDHENVTMSLFTLSKRDHDFTETEMAYYDVIESIGPDDFFILKKAIVAQHKSFTTKELLTFLRYTIWDARTFVEFYNTLMERIQTEENFPTEELISTIHHIWDHYFPIGEDGNLAYCFGSLLAYFGYDYDAIEFFQTSIQFYGVDAAIYYEIALCYFNMQVLEKSMENIEKSLVLDPNFEESLNLKKILAEYELGQ
jgi:tetratricopeptide (TPR) repeat protein